MNILFNFGKKNWLVYFLLIQNSGRRFQRGWMHEGKFTMGSDWFISRETAQVVPDALK